MKKYFKLLLVLLFGVFIITGCNNEEKKVEEKKETVALSLVKVFENEIKKDSDIESVANKIANDERLGIGTGIMEAKTGLLDGFDGEINGFTKGIVIKPMISSQPFIAYIFESKDTSKLKSELESKANKRWNICTEADDLEITVVDKYVFLVMSPSSFEE